VPLTVVVVVVVVIIIITTTTTVSTCYYLAMASAFVRLALSMEDIMCDTKRRAPFLLRRVVGLNDHE
jgi:hypothetical protein